MTQHTTHTKRILPGLLLIAGIALFIAVLHYRKVAVEHIQTSIPPLLREAVIKNIKNKTDSISFSGYSHRKYKTGTVEEREFRAADTTFTYQRTRKDFDTETLDNRQAYLLFTGSLHSSDIKFLFDSLLQDKDIYAQTTIGITASFYKKLNDWYPEDTTKMHVDFRTAYTKQGIFEDIDYHANIGYPSSTIWRFMPQSTIYILLLIELVLCGLLVAQRLLKPKEYLGVTIEAPEEKPIADITKIKLTRQSRNLLNMFIESDGYRVDKAMIRARFWPNNNGSLNNMTTAIDRLKNALTKAGCGYTINTDTNDKEYYLLEKIHSHRTPPSS